MLVKNHYNETVKIKTIKRKKAATNDKYLFVKVFTNAGATEMYNYEKFQKFNPRFNWERVE